MYLNIILTVLCLILLSIFISMIILWKKYIKKFFDKKDLQINNLKQGNLPELQDSFRLLNEMFKNLPKR